MVGHWRRPRLKSAVNLLFICMAVYLSNYLAQSSAVDSTLFLTQLSSNFNESVVLYTFQPRIVGQTSVYGLEFQESCSNDTFSLDQSTGELSIVRTIDYSQSSLEPMCVQNSSLKQDHIISLQTFFCFVTIDSRIGILVVINVIPELPSTELRFPQTFYTSHIIEGVVNATVTMTGRHTLLQVISSPVRGLTLPSYRIIGQHADSFTVIQTQRNCVTVPVVVTTQPLYRSQQDYYELTLEAYTSSTSVTATIGVQLLDVNDQLPQFTGDPMSFTLQDDTPIGMEFGRLQAVDMDTGLNGEILYVLNNSSLYSIHPLTGSLFLLSPASSSTLLSVMGIDLGVIPQTVETNVTVSIEDRSVLAPVIVIHGLGQVSEAAPMGLVVGTIEVINSSSDLEVSLTLKSNGPYEIFRLSNMVTAANESLIYDVVVNSAIDFETTPNGIHRVVLNATVGVFSTVEHYDVEITDVNEAPSFPQQTYVVNVFEGLPVGSKVTRMVASDPDQGVFGLLSYNVSGNDPNKNLIAIHSLTGTIYTTGVLDYTSVSSIQITVTAQDSRQEEAIAILTINILDRNDNMPVFTSAMNSTVIIPETNRVDDPIFHFTVSDVDSGCAGAVEYSIIHAEPQAFRIDSFSGLLFPMNETSLDYERFQTAKVVVRATDLGSSSSYSTESSLLIMLTDVDDEAPVIDPIDCPCFIQEHSSIEMCYPISAQDQDTTVLQFSIVSGNELNAFRINDAGIVSTTQMLNQAMHSSFVLSIIATDGTQASEPENLTIIVVDVNDRPTYPTSTPIMAPMDLTIGEFVGNVAAIDSDVGFNGVTLYTFQSGTNSTVTDIFYLEPLSGDLTTRRSLMTGTYTFVVVATDLSDPTSSASTTVMVTISGKKNNPPSFKLSSDRRTIPADLPSNSFVAQLSVMDQDRGANGQLAYSIVGGNHSSLFSVNSSGALITSQSLSSCAGNLYTLNISVTDHGLQRLRAYQEFIVEVYPTTIQGTFTQLVHNPAVGVCHYQGSVLEMTDSSLLIASLPQIGSQATIYRILPSTFSRAFQIDTPPSSEAELRVQTGFSNREAVFITLRAEYSDNFHLCSVTVIIEDINNNPAMFVSNSFAIEVYSGTPTGATVFQLQAVDADNASNSQMQFALDTTGSPFSLDRDSGVLTLSGSLDQPSYTLTATVTDRMYTPSQTSTATVVVTVLQTSNTPPVFIPSSIPLINISETTQTGNVIAMLSVMDADTGMHGANRFCVQSGNEHGLFRITRTGQILVHKQLDYERYPHLYGLMVRAYDSSNNPQYRDTSVSIAITDQNDETPTFSAPVYTATVMENQASGISVITVSAVDGDDGLNGVVIYSLPDSNFPFTIVPDSGDISTTSSLNREFMSNYTLTVVATDQATVNNERLSSTAEVRVFVLDENDNNPSFDVIGSVRIVVREDTASGSEIVQLVATDLDEGANSLLKYSIVSGNNDFMVSLNPWTGSLTLERSLDFENSVRRFILEFQVSDCGEPPRSSVSTLQLTVDIDDVNDNYPMFSSNIYECSFVETMMIFSSNCQVTATDVDGTLSSITYSIVNTIAGLPFRIHTQTGVLSIDTAAITDAERISQYIVQVQAHDSGMPQLSTTALVEITVEDSNDNIPIFVDPATVSTVGIPELIPNNTFLFFAHAFDRDIAVENSNNIVYQIIDESSANKFRVHPQSGAVFLDGSLDAEVSTTHVLEIRALEISTGASTQRRFDIQVFDINENLLPPTFPVEANPSIVSISRAAIRGANVTTLTAVDPEGETVSYHTIGGTGYGLFQIDMFSGHITVSLPLTAIEYDMLSLIVMADDGGQFRLTSEFMLTVALEPDENTKPFFVAPVFHTSPAESTGSEQIFTHVRAEVSGCTDTSVHYSITRGNEDGNFAINASTGAVYVSLGGSLNREVVPSYNLTVNASKPGQMDSSTALLIIELTDANDFGPAFVTDFNVSVFENHPADSSQPFVRVFAIDGDIGDNGRLSYSIRNLTVVPFEISETTGFIHLTSSLNAASVSDYTITVVARDHGIPTLDGTVTLTVNVIQPAPVDSPTPIFPSIVQQIISEGTPPGMKIATISAQNPHTKTLLYRFRESADQFAISPNSGEVYLTRLLDRENQSSFSHAITVTDGANIVTVVLSIVVTDVNEHRPQFTQEEFQISVMENVQSNLTVGRITATDPESGVVYSVVDSLDPRSMSLFGVSFDGVVYTLSSEIDREDIPVHILTVAAQDLGDPTLLNFVRLVINVVDENDNSPTLENLEIFIPEDAPVSESIFRVQAFDPDKDENARVFYTLLTANPLFSLNMTSGDIILTSSLDAETVQQHILVISASNPDGLRSSVRIIVNVIDVLDSVPRLLNPGTVTVQENLPMYTFVASLANSSEFGTSRPVFYSIVDGNNLGHFFVEPLTGIVRTSTKLDHEMMQIYNLTVQGAFESGFEVNVSFTVTVTDVNDQAPQFPSSYLSLSIPENSSFHAALINLNVTDLDGRSNALYVIVDGFAAEMFSVDTSGNLMLSQNLDRENKFSSLAFEIYVIDTDYPNLYSSATLHIEVIDSNDNRPQFQQSEYNFTISVPTQLNVPFSKVQATDADEGIYAEVQYEIIGGNGTSKFGINPLTGEITVTNNYQLQSQYLLIIGAVDGGGLQSSVEVTLYVKGCGFQSLLFLPAMFMIELHENVPPDTSLIGPSEFNIEYFDQPSMVRFSLPIFNPLFDVNPLTGRVFTRGEIDREQNGVHQLVLHAMDTDDPHRLAQADIEVRVVDENDNSPVFDQTLQYISNILNTALPGDEVIRVRATDDDIGTNSDVVYSLVASTQSGFFHIDAESGGIFVDSSLNTALLGSSVSLTVVATDMGNPPRTTEIEVIVNIVDSNAPRFTKSVYRKEVQEGIALGSQILTVAVNISSNNPLITFRLDTDNPSIPISLDFFDGVVTVVDPGFDFESDQSYSLTVLAEDSTTSLTGQATLNIIIIDENDNAPVFDAPGSFYTDSIDENVNAGTFVLQVTANDIDSPVNSEITYRLNPSSPFLDTFSIDESSGTITTLGSIDYEQYPVYELDILAEDSGMPQRTGSATVRIITNNLNDNPPLFTENTYQATISANAAVGTNIRFVAATDPDGLIAVVYSIIPVGIGHEKFAINSNGLITINQSLSESTVSMYTLNVSAFDGLRSYAAVVIVVEFSNDNPPVFNQSIYYGSVPEGSPRDVYVSQVFATDRDRGNNADITYSIANSSALVLNFFHINPQSGIITTAGGSAIDRELTPSFQFIVVARDAGGRTGNARVVVTIVDVNDSPPRFLQTEYVGSVIESAPMGFPVLPLNVSDLDKGENSTLVFSLFPINVPRDQFPFRIDSIHRVTISISLSFDVASNYTFVVSVRDNGTQPLFASENATVVINIQEDVTRNPPQFVGVPYMFSVPDNIGQTDEIGVVEVDQDTTANCYVFYRIRPSLFDGNSFDIDTNLDSKTGTIFRATSLTSGNYTIIIIVEANCVNRMDFSTYSTASMETVMIEVYELNSRPRFQSVVYSGNIIEDSVENTPIQLHNDSRAMGSEVDIEARDNDEGMNGTVIYSIPDRESMMLPFDIGPVDGVIRLTEELDYETTTAYLFQVRATDGGTPPLSDSALVFIYVTDVNDSPPEFESSLYSIAIREDTPPNATFLTVRANDNDTSSILTYFLSGAEFSISPGTGDVFTVVSLDRETRTSYTLMVVVSDGLFTDVATVLVSITDVNDNAPTFNESQITLSLTENHPTGETIAQVLAMDKDEGSNAVITYIITEQPDNGEVTIDPSTGEVSFLVSPDFEISPRLEFQVTASDGALQDFATVAIDLVDMNDNAPVFTRQNYSASVREHSSGISNVIRVEANDADSGINGTVTYRIEGSGAANFSISTTGVITTQSSFDRETDPFFDILVIASDFYNMSSSAIVHVSITDINDQRPTFPQSTYQVSVSEDEPRGFVILTTTATDSDVGINARITYALSGDYSNEFNRESHSNGSVSIVLANQLNRERLSNYSLSLRAIDGGVPEMESIVTVLVTVLDVNDNCPEFRDPRYSWTIPENITVGSTILSVEAFDRDVQSQLVYSIRDSSLVPEISIDPLTGDISIVSGLDFETRPVYNFMVDVSDGEDSCMVTPTIVNIALDDINDNPPFFHEHEPTYTIEENNMPNVIVDTFDADDRDTVSLRGRITFSIESGNVNGTFSIGAADGVLRVQTSLDREKISSYQLVITATDNGSPSLTGTTNFTIIVSDVNDNNPTGGHQDIYIYLLDGVAPIITLGHVFVNDSDLVNNHVFMIQDTNGALEIDISDGSISIGTTTPDLGIHGFQVIINDAGNQPAITTITARVMSVSENILAENSFIMQLDNISPQSFTDTVLAEFLSRVAAIISSALQSTSINSAEIPVEVQVLSIQPSLLRPQNLDITVAVKNLNDASYVHRELVQHIVHINEADLETQLGVSIHTELVDLCSDSTCISSNQVCSNVYNYNSTNSKPFGTISVTYLGLTSNHTAACGEVMPSPCEGIVCPEPSLCVTVSDEEAVCYDNCNTEPCLNGGTCVPQKFGYHCSCPEGYNGRNCEQIGATFMEGTYAVFPSIKTRLEGSILIDFITEKGNGLLAFVGRYDDNFMDYISIELIDGRPSLRVSYGPAEHKLLTLNSQLNDRQWHRVSVMYNSTVATISTVTYNPYTRANDTIAVTGPFHSLDLGGPLLLGSGYLPQNFGYSDQLYVPFVGCMRNVVVNGQLLDFTSALFSVDLVPGCDFTDVQCNPNPCLNGGRCIGSWSSYTCDCRPQFAGTTCNEESRTASFSGNNYINYEIKNPTVVRPLRQTSSSDIYRTAQNIICFSLGTKEDSGTVLQLGDPAATMEYVILEVVNGQLQLSYNLGSGEAVLIISSVNVNDAVFHNVSLVRTEQSIELLVDEMFANRTISPGSEATLDILSKHFYIGARVDVSDGILSNGLRGCVEGLRLDRKEVPIGGENTHFTTLKIFDGIQNGCPIGTLFETPQSDTSVYTTLGVSLAALFITSFIFVMICVLIQFYRDRTRTHTYHPPSREGSRRQNRRSFGNGDFAFHQPPTYRVNLESPQGNYRSSPEPPDHQPGVHLNNMNPTFSFDTKSRYPLSLPVTDVTANPVVVETDFSGRSDTKDLHSRNNIISSSRRSRRLQPIQESFSVIDQSNPGYVEESPKPSHRKSQGGPGTTDTQTSRHCRSPSAGLISLASNGTELSDATLATSIDGDVDKYIQKRKEVADIEIEELNTDSLTHYGDEGPYEPLGSIGSLYDFVKDLEQPNLNQSTSSEQYPPSRSIVEHSQSLRPRSPSSGQHAMCQEDLSCDDGQLKSKFFRQSMGQRSGKRSSTRGSHRRVDHSARMNNIMDKFHSVTVGNRSVDTMETRLI